MDLPVVQWMHAALHLGIEGYRKHILSSLKDHKGIGHKVSEQWFVKLGKVSAEWIVLA